MDELVAIERSREGDGDAFATLVNRYQDLAFRTAYVITGDAAEAEDAAQSAFVKAYFALPSFDMQRSFRPWLLTIVANEARNRRTAASRHPTVELAVVDAFQPATGEPQPDEAAIAVLQGEELIAALNGLRADDRTILTLRYFLDLSEVDLAAALNCPRGTVKSRLSRAMERLRVVMINERSGGDV